MAMPANEGIRRMPQGVTLCAAAKFRHPPYGVVGTKPGVTPRGALAPGFALTLPPSRRLYADKSPWQARRGPYRVKGVNILE